jgi:hypothetical protein
MEAKDGFTGTSLSVATAPTHAPASLLAGFRLPLAAENFLMIPSPRTLLALSAPPVRAYVAMMSPYPCVSGDVGDQFSLCGLPQSFHTFLSPPQLRTCVQCRTRQHSLHTKIGTENLCVCLLCGSFVCLTKGGAGSATNCYLTHLQQCDGRIGMFLLLKRGGEVLCLLHSAGSSVACFWPSLYLDKYGESDPTLSRGRPLTLHAGRVQTLTAQYLNMSLQDYISSHAAPIQLGTPAVDAIADGPNQFRARHAADAARERAGAASAAAAPLTFPSAVSHMDITVLPASLLQTIQSRQQRVMNTPSRLNGRTRATREPAAAAPAAAAAAAAAGDVLNSSQTPAAAQAPGHEFA